MKLDDIDRSILRTLQRDGRIQNIELAREIGLSPSPCLRRVKLLEDAGVIKGYSAVIDAASDSTTISRFVEAIAAMDQVVECHLMAGECDALLRVVAADLNDYYRFQADHLSRVDGVSNVKTDVPMQT
ncbi:hypothetical protein LTR94_025469, partial [Friedmanniomyces endolithicus]